MRFDKYKMTSIHQYSIIQNSVTAPKMPCVPPLSLSPSLSPVPFDSFPGCYIVEIIQYVAFHIGFFAFIVRLLSPVRLFAIPWTACARLPCPSPSPGVCSLSNMYLRFLYAFSWFDSAFLPLVSKAVTLRNSAPWIMK